MSMQTGKTWVASIRRLGFLLLVTACAQTAGTSQWHSPLYQDHSLVGSIWSSGAEEFVDQEHLLSSMLAARYVLFGEKHDNPDHHDLQLRLLSLLLEEDTPMHVTFEMLDSSSDSRLQAFGNQRFTNQEQIKAYLQWDEEGWDWDFYGPLLEAAHGAAVEVKSGNISNETVGRVYSEPTPADIAAVFDDEVMEKLNADIDASHCGLLPESQFPAMVRVQQTRDDRMAKQLATESQNDKAVLVAGNYHVRQDLGVPNYLLAQDESLARSDILTVAFLEVQAGENEPARYLEQFSEVPAYDYIWFTPAVTAEDYCDSLR